MSVRGACSIDGCERPTAKRGWCGAHYWRWRKHGSPLAGKAPVGAHQAFIEAALTSETEDCIDWPYGLSSGYGRTADDYAHRIVCERTHGPAPTEDYQAAHGCGRPPCINPRHLRWATPLENDADKVGHGTSARGELSQFSKLTEAQVRAIRGLRGVVRGSSLARCFGVSKTTVSLIQRGVAWRWIDTP